MAVEGNRSWYQNYDPSIPRSYVYPEIPVKEMFLAHASTKGDKPYIILDDIVLKYQTANMIARKFANALLDLGVKKGDRVGLMAANIPQYILALQACFKIGAIAVPANPLYTADEITHQFGDCGAETVVVMAMFADKVIEARKSGKTSIKNIITIQLASLPVDMSGKEVIDFNELAGKGEDIEPDIDVRHDDIAMLQYTGGTTGVSKGCCLTNYNIVSMAYQIGHQMLEFCPYELVKCLGIVPLYHIFGFNTTVNACNFTGGSIVLVPRPDLNYLLDCINKHEPTILTAVPALIIGLNNHPKLGESKIGSLKGVICGSSPLSVESFNEFEKKSGAWIVEGYGSSETTNIVTANMKGKRKIGSVGLPWPDVDLKIVDLDSGEEEMAVGKEGEIIVKGPQVMNGYWMNEEETAFAMKDGWFFTGDIGYIDEDGFVFIVDRKKDMILCSGFNVYPRDIDEVLYQHPAVLEACAIGIPDAKRGETVKAFVVLKEGESLGEDDVKNYCREKLAPYKVPTHVEFLEELPRSAVGKPLRRMLRDRETGKE
ncbi:MAG TPA: long-chain fatty acid--CoA ligase [Spirochaetota bacterium]|nr:long-chain fatty acid--CoA ligase [Spirochaetota bacterium]HPJ33355.1 long-chain fatty acid--CoA ligase [Spirochaetota bacterium]